MPPPTGALATFDARANGRAARGPDPMGAETPCDTENSAALPDEGWEPESVFAPSGRLALARALSRLDRLGPIAGEGARAPGVSE